VVRGADCGHRSRMGPVAAAMTRPLQRIAADRGRCGAVGSASVTLNVAAADPQSGVTNVRLSNNGATWTTSTYTPTKAWTLPIGRRANRLRGVARRRGNWSTPVPRRSRWTRLARPWQAHGVADRGQRAAANGRCRDGGLDGRGQRIRRGALRRCDERGRPAYSTLSSPASHPASRACSRPATRTASASARGPCRERRVW